MACGNAPKVEGLMRSAARLEETFYGLLARETLGMQAQMNVLTPRFDRSDWSQLKQYPNVRASIALAEIGENELADQELRHQAPIGTVQKHDALLNLARGLSLPDTQIWLANNAPPGQRPCAHARYPMHKWTPETRRRGEQAQELGNDRRA